jgi:hypothetical protein
MELKENEEDRTWMIEWWAEYIRSHPDKDWSEKQRILIDSVYE